MRRLIAITSVVVLGLAAPVFAQSSMGVDVSGRFDGSPPFGTSPETEQSSGGFSIPLDSIETGSTSDFGNVQLRNCAPAQTKGHRNAAGSQLCVEGY